MTGVVDPGTYIFRWFPLPDRKDASLVPPPTLALGAGRYVIRERLGAGAVGEVWSADDPQIDRRVAVKFLRAPDQLSAAQRTEWENRFLLEARAAGRLSHPGIVPIFDVGTASDGRSFIVMELVDGRSLEALRLAEPHPTVEQVLRWTLEIAEALDAAHGRGVVHRDVKPANMLIGADGRARIADFGIARVADSDLTRDGAFLGSPSFASPEQLRGSRIDGRADLFSLGAVLYLLSTRQRPFEGDDIPTIVYAACHAEPRRPSSLNPELSPAIDTVILRALQKNPEARFQTGREFAGALRSANIDAKPAGSPAVSPVDRTVRDEQILAAPTAEDRAASLASAAAVSAVRASRATAEGTRRLAAEFMEWARRTEPQVRRGVTSFAARVKTASPAIGSRVSRAASSPSTSRSLRSRGGIAAILITAVTLAILAGRPWAGDDSASRNHAWERLRGVLGGKSSRVNVLVEHSLPEGSIELSDNEGVILSNALKAPEKAVLGLSFFTYRSGTETSKARLSPGRHELTIKVKGRDDLELLKSLTVQVEPRSEYDLQISIATWPRARMSADWSRISE